MFVISVGDIMLEKFLQIILTMPFTIQQDQCNLMLNFCHKRNT